MRCAHESMRRVPLAAVRQVPGPQGGGRGDGGRVWETGSSAGQLSVLIGYWRQGGRPPFPSSAIGWHHSYHLSQSEK